MPTNLGAVRAFVKSLTLDEHGRALAQAAESLALLLDDKVVFCPECSALVKTPTTSARDAAAVAKELRATLDALKPEANGDDDDWTAQGSPAVGAAEVRNGPGRVEGHVRPSGGRRGKTVGPGADAAPATRVGRKSRA